MQHDRVYDTQRTIFSPINRVTGKLKLVLVVQKKKSNNNLSSNVGQSFSHLLNSETKFYHSMTFSCYRKLKR
jgi:hypothetical protein